MPSLIQVELLSQSATLNYFSSPLQVKFVFMEVFVCLPCTFVFTIHFRNHVLKNLHSSVFKKPICEVMLNQAYFNGIGNYLRAEILYRYELIFWDSKDLYLPGQYRF